MIIAARADQVVFEYASGYRNAENELAFSPGDGFRYSNAGYALLTRIIEAVSGKSYAEFLKENIITPLGLKGVEFGSAELNDIRGYPAPATNRDARRIAPVSPIDRLGGAGGLRSDARTLVRWPHRLRFWNVLSKASYADITVDHGDGYGYGWRLSNKFGHALIWHSGLDPNAGFSAIIEYYPEHDLTLLVLTNNLSMSNATAHLEIAGTLKTFRASAARKAIDTTGRAFLDCGSACTP